MEVGTSEIIEEIEEPKRRRSGLTGGSGTGNGGGRDPGGGGSDTPDENEGLDDQRFVPDKSRILTGLLLLVVMMTFGGLMAAYIVSATNNAIEWRPFDLPKPVWISTILILISSITYHLGKTAIFKGDQPAAKKWFLATTALGAAFISSQILAWVVLTAQGLYMSGNPYAGFFYIMTAVHAIHVLGGIIALGSVVLRSWYPTENPEGILKRRTIAQVVGWYWHFMGGLWVVLFILLGFWQ